MTKALLFDVESNSLGLCPQGCAQADVQPAVGLEPLQTGLWQLLGLTLSSWGSVWVLGSQVLQRGVPVWVLMLEMP